jgi:hypothetical protein
MTYEDPQSGRERNLGQDDAANSTGSLIIAVVLLAAIAVGGWYFYNRSENVADVNQPTPSTAAQTTPTTPTTPAETNAAENNTMSPQSSGPGVEGATGSKNGPSAQPENNSSSTGASSGNTGVGGDTTNIDKSTLPSQDSKGVQGAPGSTNGPAGEAPAPTNQPNQ